MELLTFLIKLKNSEGNISVRNNEHLQDSMFLKQVIVSQVKIGLQHSSRFKTVIVINVVGIIHIIVNEDWVVVYLFL